MTSSMSPVFYGVGVVKRFRDGYLSYFEKLYMCLSANLLLMGVLISVVGTVFSLTLIDNKHNALTAIKKIIVG